MRLQCHTSKLQLRLMVASLCSVCTLFWRVSGRSGIASLVALPRVLGCRRQDGWTSSCIARTPLRFAPLISKAPVWAPDRSCRTSLYSSVLSLVRRWWWLVNSCHSSVRASHCSWAPLSATSGSLIRAGSCGKSVLWVGGGATTDSHARWLGRR